MNHPGQINNNELLDDKDVMLKGTGKVKGLESDYVDQYLRNDVREGMHFDVINGELWEMISTEYGADTAIKRFYYKENSYSMYTSVDTRLKLIPVWILNTALL